MYALYFYWRCGIQSYSSLKNLCILARYWRCECVLILFVCLWAVFLYGHFAYSVIHEITHALGIYCFRYIFLRPEYWILFVLSISVLLVTGLMWIKSIATLVPTWSLGLRNFILVYEGLVSSLNLIGEESPLACICFGRECSNATYFTDLAIFLWFILHRRMKIAKKYYNKEFLKMSTSFYQNLDRNWLLHFNGCCKQSCVGRMCVVVLEQQGRIVLWNLRQAILDCEISNTILLFHRIGKVKEGKGA